MQPESAATGSHVERSGSLALCEVTGGRPRCCADLSATLIALLRAAEPRAAAN